MTRLDVGRRLERLRTAREAVGLDGVCRRLADRLGMDPGELRAGAERVATRCRDAGVWSTDACLIVVAGDLGIDPDELRAEVASVVAEAGR